MGEELNWDTESASYIRLRPERYPGGQSIEPAWAQEVLDDIDLVAFEPDPKSRMGASRFIGPRPEPIWPTTSKKLLMSKTIDPDLAARLREESEQSKESPFPSGAVPTRPNRLRSKVYSVRLSEEEQAQVQRVADAQHLPASTLVRAWILERLEREQSA